MEEYRWSARRPIELAVNLYFKDQVTEGCRTRDLGLGGMFVVYPDPDMKLNSEVEIAIRNPVNLKDSRLLPAKVVHRHSDGIGIMFMDFSVQDLRLLQDIFQNATHDQGATNKAARVS
ncbi:MAG TPA: PilZ domain-containing protein [Gammaproteobacteria bacterium]|nr:PilZ domain-containing protein [Gammaproteobacteria bacterium]